MTTKRLHSPWSRALACVAMAVLLLALSGVVAGCSGQTGNHSRDAAQEATLPEGFPEAPDWYHHAPKPIQETYLAAAHHHDELQHIPCYCGCGAFHASNSDCYFQRDEAGAVVAFDRHAVGCQICLDITRQTVAGLESGKSLTRIRQEIDEAYQAMGLTPTPTPLPPPDQ